MKVEIKFIITEEPLDGFFTGQFFFVTERTGSEITEDKGAIYKVDIEPLSILFYGRTIQEVNESVRLHLRNLYNET